MPLLMPDHPGQNTLISSLFIIAILGYVWKCISLVHGRNEGDDLVEVYSFGWAEELIVQVVEQDPFVVLSAHLP